MAVSGVSDFQCLLDSGQTLARLQENIKYFTLSEYAKVGGALTLYDVEDKNAATAEMEQFVLHFWSTTMVITGTLRFEARGKGKKEVGARPVIAFVGSIVQYSRNCHLCVFTGSPESGAGDEAVLLEGLLIHYQIDTAIPLKLRQLVGDFKMIIQNARNSNSNLNTGLRRKENGVDGNEMGAQEKEERLAFLEIKRREVECRERELEQKT
ncbi:hypothetical protein Tco_0868736 [Tanacetum coccineum]